MAIPRIGAPGQGLPTFPGLAPQTSGTNAGTIAGTTNVLTLAAGETFVPPAGQYQVQPGPYTFVQEKDPISTQWITRPTSATNNILFNTDGTNWRLANLTGCVIGAVITTGGTAAILTNGIGSTTNGVSFTASSGGSTWQTIVGGAIASAIATSTAAGSTAGSGYTFPPIVIIDAPPAGGLQATAFCSLSGGSTVTAASITVVNQGAGYASAPNITFVNDPRDTTGAGAFYVTTLTATGQLTGLYPISNGTALTGVPTLTVSTGIAAATAIMNWTVTAFALASTTTQGSSLVAGTYVVSTSNTVASLTSSPVLNPTHAHTGITFPRPARIIANISAGVITSTGQVVEDGGLGIQQVPSTVVIPVISSTTGTIPLSGLGTPTVGGVTDTSFIQVF